MIRVIIADDVVITSTHSLFFVFVFLREKNGKRKENHNFSSENCKLKPEKCYHRILSGYYIGVLP